MNAQEIIQFAHDERVRQNLTRYRVAAKAHLSSGQTVAGIEEGGRVPRLDNIVAILDVLGYELDIIKKEN